MYRVLIVDDEMIERMALGRRLERHFGDMFRIYQAESGEEALEVFREKEIQIVIMDIGMPGMSGVEAAERIRRTDRNVVIIFLTAYDEFSYAKRAISIGVLEYLLKPCDDEELLPVMEEALRQVDLRKKYEIQPSEASGEPDGEMSESGIHKTALTIREYVHSHYMEEISMQDAARAMNYSDAYFCKLFKQCFDQNFTAYLTGMRITEAKRLLRDRQINVKDVSAKVGYADSRYFAKVFKRMTGMLPSEYRDSENAQK